MLEEQRFDTTIDEPAFASARTPVILAALPRSWRYLVAPAMAKEFFEPHFHPERHTTRQVLTIRPTYYAD